MRFARAKDRQWTEPDRTEPDRAKDDRAREPGTGNALFECQRTNLIVLGLTRLGRASAIRATDQDRDSTAGLSQG